MPAHFSYHYMVPHNPGDGDSASSYSFWAICPFLSLGVPPLPASAHHSEKILQRRSPSSHAAPPLRPRFLPAPIHAGPSCGSVCASWGRGVIFPIVPLRSIPALPYVIHGARLGLGAEIPQVQNSCFIFKCMYLNYLKEETMILHTLSNLTCTTF